MIPSNFNINFPYSGYANNFNSAVFFNQNLLSFQQNPQNLIELLNFRSQLQRQLIQTEIHNLAKMNVLSLSPAHENVVLYSSRTNSCLKENLESSPMVDLPNDSNIRTEAQIKYMIQFFVNNHGIIKENEMQTERSRYTHDKKLLKLFDTLNRKYSSTTKTKEELIKWVIRRAIKSGKDHETENEENCEKTLKKLHSEDGQKASPNHDDEESHDVWIESLLPFKKSSKNKTMNSQFLAEIFASERFRADYHTFMGEIEKVIEEDTADKMRRFLQFVIDCVNKDTMEKIIKYRRVPWLKKWGNNARKIALQIKPKKNAPISHHY